MKPLQITARTAGVRTTLSTLATEISIEVLTSETAAAFEASVAAGQPVTTRLIVTGIAEALRDEQTVADLLRRSMLGENPFADLVRDVIRDEAEQIASAYSVEASARRAA